MSGFSAGGLIHLVAETAGLVPGAPYFEAILGLRGRELLKRLPAFDPR